MKDLSFRVNLLSRYLDKNNEEIWKNSRTYSKIFNLKGSIEIKWYKRDHYKNISTDVVSGRSGNDYNRKSTTSYLVNYSVITLVVGLQNGYQ